MPAHTPHGTYQDTIPQRLQTKFLILWYNKYKYCLHIGANLYNQGRSQTLNDIWARHFSYSGVATGVARGEECHP